MLINIQKRVQVDPKRKKTSIQMSYVKCVEMCTHPFQLLQPRTTPAYLLGSSLLSENLGSLPRLQDTAAAFPFVDPQKPELGTWAVTCRPAPVACVEPSVASLVPVPSSSWFGSTHCSCPCGSRRPQSLQQLAPACTHMHTGVTSSQHIVLAACIQKREKL